MARGVHQAVSEYIQHLRYIMNIYTCHRYRGVLLQRLMAAEATPTQSLEDTWVEVSTSCVHEL